MQFTLSRRLRVGVLGLFTVMGAGLVGCDGQPETGSQVQVTPEQEEQRSKGIMDAMKSGAYTPPPGAVGKAPKKDTAKKEAAAPAEPAK